MYVGYSLKKAPKSKRSNKYTDDVSAYSFFTPTLVGDQGPIS